MAIIIFDFDGVLADTLDDLLNFAKEACMQLGLQRNPTPADLDALDTMSFADYGRQLMVPVQAIDQFVSLCLQMFNQRQQLPKIFEGMEEVITEAAKHNKIAIVTGNTTPMVKRFLEEYNLQDQVELIIGVEQKGSRPEKIRHVIKELAQNADSAYIIGDSISDILAARETGVTSIAVGWGHQSPSRLLESNPDHLVKSPSALLELLKGR